MGTMSTIQALIFIVRALIELGQFLTGKINKHQYSERIDKMSESIRKATSGDLEGRLEGGQEVEDRINENT